jgi:hypothetical protein
MEKHLVIFTRYPEAGKTKTRLVPLLGPEGAANLAKKMTEETVHVAKSFCKESGAILEVRFVGSEVNKMKKWLGENIKFSIQPDGDLGEKMSSSFNEAIEKGANKVIIIGSDCPDVDEKSLSEAFSALDNDDLVLGLAKDGGYYLIGLKTPQPELFQNIDWGTEKVLEQTVRAAATKRLSVKFLETLSDIDLPEDLVQLRNQKTIGSDKKISIIVPTLNESENIATTLFSLRDATNIEIIIVDGGSSDNTVEIANSIGVSKILTKAGRARQQNAGAAAATGEILIFLHADTYLPKGFENEVRKSLDRQNVVAGAFKFNLDGDGFGLRIVERLANFRSKRMQKPYGDQAIFLKKTLFQKLGGFPDLPLMEDYEFVRCLKKIGKIETLSSKATTSNRRWKKRGLVKTTLLNQAIITGYHLGISPARLARWYRK